MVQASSKDGGNGCNLDFVWSHKIYATLELGNSEPSGVAMAIIRLCREGEHGAILAIVNAAAEAAQHFRKVRTVDDFDRVSVPTRD